MELHGFGILHRRTWRRKKVLKPISYFLKDEIDIALCVNAINVLGKRLAVEQSIPLGYTEDILVKLGISNKEG